MVRHSFLIRAFEGSNPSILDFQALKNENSFLVFFMIQVGTVLNVIDNCGAKKAYCIRILENSKKRYAKTGDLVLVVIKTLRKKRRSSSKVKKGEIFTALVVRTKKKVSFSFSDDFSFLENSIILLNKQHKFIGTRIFGPIPKSFRSTKYMRIFSLSSGVCF